MKGSVCAPVGSFVLEPLPEPEPVPEPVLELVPVPVLVPVPFVEDDVLGVVALVAEPLDGVDDPLDVGLVVGGLVVPVCVWLLFGWHDAASGSMYCWSPAEEGLQASAAAGISSATAQTTTTDDTNLCQSVTLRVLQVLNLFAFSDLHRNRDRAGHLVELASDADVVIGAGDYGSMHVGVGAIIETLSAISIPTVLVPGNNETDGGLRRACEGWTAATVLHGDGVEIEGVEFFGLGAGVPKTPFPWSFDLSEEEAASRLEACPRGGVLVVHSPPRGYVDESGGRHLGSEAILGAIERTNPVLAVCGHIHESWAREARIGATRVVNLGPQGAFIEI